jgi:threonine dehydrogenase-like Zn-dependent dehydrogenase
MHLIVSKAIGARVIVADLNEERLAKARQLGADFSLNPSKVDMKEEVKKITEFGADVVIAAVGVPRVVEQSLPLVRNGGVFNIFGGTPRGETIELDPRWLHYGEVVVTGTFAASLGHFKRAIEFVRENTEAVSEVISVRCGLEDVLNAVERIKQGHAMKTVIMFP